MPPPPSQKEIDSGAQNIVAAFQSGKPFFIGRNGSTEMELLSFWMWRRANPVSWPRELMNRLQQYSGVWPSNPDLIQRWADTYTEALRELDGVAAGWYAPQSSNEFKLLEEFAPTTVRMPLRSLEPYYVKSDLRWTRFLAGKRVVVISSFAESIAKQVRSQERGKLWSAVSDSETLLPSDATFLPIRSYFPPMISMGDATGWPVGIHTWETAVSSLVQQATALKPDVVLIGCGGLGMLVGAELKRQGISSLLLGGAIQVLFGIKGRRWERHEIISKFWNEHWIWPSQEEMPVGAGYIEGACYWGSRPSSTPR